MICCTNLYEGNTFGDYTLYILHTHSHGILTRPLPPSLCLNTQMNPASCMYAPYYAQENYTHTHEYTKKIKKEKYL